MSTPKRITDRIEAKLNEQVKVEINASHTYHQISMYCTVKGYLGAAKWYLLQSQEEMEHAQRVLNYIADRSGIPQVGLIEQPVIEYNNLGDLLRRSLLEEIKVEESWKNFIQICKADKDESSYKFAQWYIKQQIEEIGTVTDMIAMFDSLVNGTDCTLACNRLDHMMSKRKN